MTFKEPGRTEVFVTLLAQRLFRSFHRKYVDNLGLRGDERVLDFGSGAGSGSRYIAERLSKGRGELTCVDISKVWLETAKKKMKRFKNVKFALGDISDLNIEESSQDVVVIHFTFHDIPPEQRQDKVNALVKTLKKGGRLFIKEPRPLPRHRPGHGMSAEEIRQLMTQSGLEEIDSKTTRSFLTGAMYEGVFAK